MTEKEFDEIDFSEYLFRSRYLDKEQARGERLDMIAARFSWTYSRVHGAKQSFKDFAEMFGFEECAEQKKYDIKHADEQAMRILKKLGRI